MTYKVKTRRYSIPGVDDATILSIFDKAAHYSADKRTVSLTIAHKPVPSVQTLFGLQRRHPEVDWHSSRLINCVSADYGPIHLDFVRAADAGSELSLMVREDSHVTDMVRFIATQAALLRLRPTRAGSLFAGRDERRQHTARLARAGRLRLRIEAPDRKAFANALQKYLPRARTYIPMRAVSGRLRSVSPERIATAPRVRFLERRFISIATALVTLLAGAQAVSFLHP